MTFNSLHGSKTTSAITSITYMVIFFCGFTYTVEGRTTKKVPKLPKELKLNFLHILRLTCRCD